MTDLDVDAIVAAFRERGEVPTDAQAMALVKEFDIECIAPLRNHPLLSAPDNDWTCIWQPGGRHLWASGTDLNAAIVECVTKLKGAKP